MEHQDIRRTIFLIGAAHGFTHVYQIVLPPLYPVLSRELGLSYTELGLLTTGMAFSFGISQLAMGPLSDRMGRKWLICAGQFLFAAATAMCGLVSTFRWLLVLQIIGGIGGSVLHPVGVALLTDVTRETQRGRAMGIHGSGGNLGTAIAPVTMVYLTIMFNWRFAMITMGVLGMMFVILTAACLVEPPRVREEISPGHDSSEKGSYPFSTLALCMVLMIWVARSVSNRAYQAFLPTFLVNRYDLSLELSGIFVTVYWIFSALAQLMGGYLTDRYNYYAVLWAAFFLTGASMSVMLFARPELGGILYVNVLLLGMFSFIGYPAFFSLYSEGLQKARSGTFYSLGFTVAFTVSAGVPGVMGWLTDRFNAAAAFYPVLVLVFSPLAILPVLRKMRRAVYEGTEPGKGS